MNLNKSDKINNIISNSIIEINKLINPINIQHRKNKYNWYNREYKIAFKFNNAVKLFKDLKYFIEKAPITKSDNDYYINIKHDKNNNFNDAVNLFKNLTPDTSLMDDYHMLNNIFSKYTGSSYYETLKIYKKAINKNIHITLPLNPLVITNDSNDIHNKILTNEVTFAIKQYDKLIEPIRDEFYNLEIYFKDLLHKSYYGNKYGIKQFVENNFIEMNQDYERFKNYKHNISQAEINLNTFLKVKNIFDKTDKEHHFIHLHNPFSNYQNHHLHNMFFRRDYSLIHMTADAQKLFKDITSFQTQINLYMKDLTNEIQKHKKLNPEQDIKLTPKVDEPKPTTTKSRGR